MAGMKNNIRKHWRFCLSFPLLAVVMTWPTVVHVFDTTVFWLPQSNPDIWMKFWDAWRLPAIIADSGNYFFTDKLFYPAGLSLVYHNFNLPHMLFFSALQRLMPAANAFNLCYLLIILANGAAAYIFFARLFRHRSLATVGALIFGLNPFVLSQPHHPDTILIAVLPLSLYCLDRGVSERRTLWIAGAGFFIALTLYIGMYIYVCLAITVGAFVLAYAKGHWNNRVFWRRMLLLALIVAAFSFIRVYPLIADSADFSQALDKPQGKEIGNDLLSSFINPGHPLLPPDYRAALDQYRPHLTDGAYLGYLPLILTALGMLRGRRRRGMAPWLLLLLLFFVLRLGSALELAGHRFDQIILPKHFLAQLLPPLFEPFWETSHFQIGVALPLAALACFGLKTALESAPAKYHLALVAFVLLFTAYEYYRLPSAHILPTDALDFLDWLRAEEDQAEIRLIHLPMGRTFSKEYGFYQSLGGYPHIEGLASRTPTTAYDYIRGNLILDAWRRGQAPFCFPASRALFQSHLSPLLQDGLSHVVLHRQRYQANLISAGFTGLPPAYADDYVNIYRLAQLRDNCSGDFISALGLPPRLRSLALSPDIVADEGMSVLSFHPSERIADPSLRALSSLFLYWKRLDHVYSGDGELRLQSPDGKHSDLNAYLSHQQVLLLAYDPRHAESDAFARLAARLADGFQACQRVVDSAELVAVYYLGTDFDCDLLGAANRMEVDYDNRVRLKNLVYSLDGANLHIESWWTRHPAAAHGVSLQVFDGDGAKVAGSDFVLHHGSLARQGLDLSALASGRYRLKLILYDYESGASVSGVIVSSGARFEREFEIGSLDL